MRRLACENSSLASVMKNLRLSSSVSPSVLKASPVGQKTVNLTECGHRACILGCLYAPTGANRMQTVIAQEDEEARVEHVAGVKVLGLDLHALRAGQVLELVLPRECSERSS